MMQFLVLRKLGVSLTFSFVIAIVYSLLPNYSTARFWYSANQVNLSVMFFLVSFYSDLKALELSKHKFWLWKIISLISLSFSVLAYEIVFPLYILSHFFLWMISKNFDLINTKKHFNVNLIKILIFNIMFLFLVAFYKINITDRIDTNVKYLDNLKRIIFGVFDIHILEYGIKFPTILFKIFKYYPDKIIFLIAIITSFLLFIFIYNQIRINSDFNVKTGYFFKLILVGIIILFLGYGVSIYTTDIGFVLTGVENRID